MFMTICNGCQTSMSNFAEKKEGPKEKAVCQEKIMLRHYGVHPSEHQGPET